MVASVPFPSACPLIAPTFFPGDLVVPPAAESSPTAAADCPPAALVKGCCAWGGSEALPPPPILPPGGGGGGRGGAAQGPGGAVRLASRRPARVLGERRDQRGQSNASIRSYDTFSASGAD